MLSLLVSLANIGQVPSSWCDLNFFTFKVFQLEKTFNANACSKIIMGVSNRILLSSDRAVLMFLC